MRGNSEDMATGTLTRVFGVGCFEFRISRPIPYSVTSKEYADVLATALNKLSGLSDVAVDYRVSRGGLIEISEEIPSLRDGGCYPALPFSEISFSLSIPSRVQEELVRGGLVFTETEKFRLWIRQCVLGPVAYVECVGAGYECRPSQAVEVVRNYLDKESKNIDDVTFESLEPSPFQMDFHVREELDVDDMEAVVTARKGYDRMDMEVGWSLTPVDALDRVFYELDNELDAFYHLERERVIQMNAWNCLEEQRESLLELVGGETHFYSLMRKLQIHRMAKDLVTEAFAFAADHSISKQSAAEVVSEIYGRGLKTYLREYIERHKLSAFPDYPTLPIVDWARHVHDTSLKVAELATVFLSALLGGAIGAIATAMPMTKSAPNLEQPHQISVPAGKPSP